MCLSWGKLGASFQAPGGTGNFPGHEKKILKKPGVEGLGLGLGLGLKKPALSTVFLGPLVTCVGEGTMLYDIGRRTIRRVKQRSLYNQK